MNSNPYAAAVATQSAGRQHYPLILEGFEGRELVVTGPGMFSGSQLLVDGEPAPRGRKSNQFVLKRNDGTEVELKLVTNLIDPVPKVEVAGQTIFLEPPFQWYQYVWAGMPLALIAIGGLLGGLCGATATVLNGRIFRANWNGWFKYLLTGLVSFSTVAMYMVLIAALHLMLRRR